MKMAAKSKRTVRGRSVAGDEERTSPRLLEMREGDFKIQADFWREILHVTSPKISKDMAFGATLKTHTNAAKSPVVTVWLKSLEEVRDKDLRAEITHSIKTALTKNGYSVTFR